MADEKDAQPPSPKRVARNDAQDIKSILDLNAQSHQIVEVMKAQSGEHVGATSTASPLPSGRGLSPAAREQEARALQQAERILANAKKGPINSGSSK